jgi:transglutaminase-like putative cysteine protease
MLRLTAACIIRFGLFLFSLMTIFTASAWADQTIVYKSLEIDYDVRPDGLFTQTMRGEIMPMTVGAAADVGQLPLDYSESMEDLEIVEAYTLKPGDRRLPVNTKAIFSQAPSGVTQFPMFTDMRRKVVVFPQVAVNDSVVWQTRTRLKQPRLPGHFTTQEVFSRTVAFEKVEVVIRAPRSLPLTVETHGMTFRQETHGDTILYRWTYSAPKAVGEEEAVLSPYDREPRLFASSFKSYEDFSRAYGAMIRDKVVVTPAVQALADEITANITDRREQARRIYEWVSRSIRYVAVFLGNGGLVPHDPETVIANGYGDCKDHTILYASLLKAKGIESELALINLGNAYSLPKVPTLAPLNHIINWLPEFGLYADTTAGVANFGTLPLDEYGKPVVHVLSTGKALRAVPVLAKDAASSTIRTVAKLASDGTVSGRTIASASGAFAIGLRQFGMWVQATGPERAAKQHLEVLRLPGKGSYQAKPSTFNEDSHSIVAQFELQMSPRWAQGDSFTPPVGLQPTKRPGDMLMGPLDMPNLAADEKTPCYSGKQTEEVSLELPAGKRVVVLPKDVVIQNEFLRYSSRWAVAGQLVTVRRDFVVTVTDPLCTGRSRTAAVAALRAIREDYQATIALADR